MVVIHGFASAPSYGLHWSQAALLSGRQFLYCFFLATLTSASTPTSLTQARDRVAGVVLGLTVMSKCRVQLLEARLHNPATGSVSVDWTIQQFSDVVTQMHTLHGPSHNVPY